MHSWESQSEVEHAHGSDGWCYDHAGQGREHQPAQVSAQEHNTGAPPGEVHLARQPGVAWSMTHPHSMSDNSAWRQTWGKLERDEESDDANPDIEEGEAGGGCGGEAESGQDAAQEAG